MFINIYNYLRVAQIQRLAAIFMDPYFKKKYKLIASTKTFNSSTTAQKICKFCKCDKTKVSFGNLPHAIPELLGENNFISGDECDECNNKFSAYETHLSTFFLPYLTMAGVKGKRKVPEFHSRTENRDEATRTIVKVGEDGNRKILLSDLTDYVIDEEKKTMSITFRKPPHKPYWVYKALVKIGLSLMPEEYIDKFNESYKWLLDKACSVDYFITAFITVLTRNKFAKPFAELYLAKRNIYKTHFIPQSTLIVGFGNIVAQIFLPEFNFEKTKEKQPQMNLYPGFAFDKTSSKTKFTINAVDLKSKVSVTYNETLHFSFHSAELNIGK